MKRVIPALFLACALQAAAGEVTCSSGGVTTIDPVSCSLGPVTSTLVNSTPNLNGNIFAVARAGQSVATPSSEPGSGSASFDDVFSIPESPVSDVFKIAILIQTDSELNSSLGPLFSEIKISSTAAGSPVLDYNSLDAFDNCHRLGCAFLIQVPAFAFNVLELNGSESLQTFDSVAGGFAFSFASVSISRFASDGVTPDPFTPEPASAGLAGGALIVLLAATYLKRRRSAVAYS